MKAISVETMKELDAQTIADGTAAETLMERAGQGVFREIKSLLSSYWHGCQLSQFSVFAGKGNNGGDAYVVARLLAEHGYGVRIFAVCPPDELTGAAAFHADKTSAQVPIETCRTAPQSAFSRGTIVIDGLLGTGIKGKPRAPYDQIIAGINSGRRPVVAIDVPSGLDADNGDGSSKAVRADLTVTMAQPKAGVVTPQGLAACGRLRRADIGIDPELTAKAPAECEAILADDMVKFQQPRPLLSHKNTFGRVCVVAGSRQYTGAAALAAGGALRSGTGLVRMAVPESIRHLMQAPFNALIFDVVPDNGNGYFAECSIEALLPCTGQSDAVIMGPGIGTHAETSFCLRELLQTATPVVLDADGLNILAEHPDWAQRKGILVLTPHPGEMQRLLTGFGLEQQQTSSRQGQACALASMANAWVVLKGFGSILAAPSGEWAVNTSGNHALASAGTGDVMSGLIGGFLAQGFTPWEAIVHGTYLHGIAGEIASQGSRALVADDVIATIPYAFKELTPFP